MLEFTLVILKPDAVQLGYTALQIRNRLINLGLTILYENKETLPADKLREHYAHVSHLSFFEHMIQFMSSADSYIMILQGEDAISKVRKAAGPTKNAPEGTIRGDFGADGYKNLIHASDSVENAKIEIKRLLNDSILTNLLLNNI